MEFCKKCLEGKCYYHEWFTGLKLKDENEILIAELNHILEYGIIDRVVEKVYLVENHLDYTQSRYSIDFISGDLDFKANVPTSAKKDDFYVPVSCYSGKDDVVNHRVEISVGIIRHNPMKLVIRKDIWSDEVLHEIQLIDSCDYLHMESIDDYHKIVELAKSRLSGFITGLQKEKEELIDE